MWGILAPKRLGAFIAVLIFSSSQAYALRCLDIQGAKIDPDLAVMSTVYGRLLPDSKQIKTNKVQDDKITIERLVATKIVSDDGTATAQITLSKTGQSIVSAVVDKQKLSHTFETKLAGLGYQPDNAKLTTALKNIGQPPTAFIAPAIAATGVNVALAKLSTQFVKIQAGKVVARVVGTIVNEEKTLINYTCSEDAEFAGNPNILRSMVVMHGVLKATTTTETTNIKRALDVTVTDVVSRKTVTRQEFETLLAKLPGLKETKPVAIKVADAKPTETIKEVPTPDPSSTTNLSSTSSALTDMIEFFSLQKTGTWILLLLITLISLIGLFLLRRQPSVKIAEQTKIDSDAMQDHQPEQSPTERITLLKEATQSGERLQKHLQDTLKQAKIEITGEMENKQKLDELREEIGLADKENDRLRSENVDTKAKLDKSEIESRDLNAQVLELKATAARSENELIASQVLTRELEETNQKLTEFNEEYRDQISTVESEHTVLMERLTLREKAISRTESLNKKIMGLNEEADHSLSSEISNRETLEKEFERLTMDYNTLWTQSSNRLSKLREEDSDKKTKIRTLNDAVMSLTSELEFLRKDRTEFNREFIILGTENSRLEKEYRAKVVQLERNLKQLNMKLTSYSQILHENNIDIPGLSRLPAVQRDLGKYVAEIDQVYRKESDEAEADTLDNVILLAHNRTDGNK